MAATLTVTWLPLASVDAQHGAASGEWRSYAGDMWGTKYAPLDQITADNFGDLEVAWRWRTADSHLPFEDEHGISLIPAETLFDRLEAAEPGRWGSGRDARQVAVVDYRPDIATFFQATPLMVDGVLYLSTPLYQAAAVDARTGETRWVYNPRVYEAGSPRLDSGIRVRGPTPNHSRAAACHCRSRGSCAMTKSALQSCAPQ